MKLLLAEDERSLSKTIIHILRKNNYSADAVYDGEAALTYLNTGNYDAVILDVMMPKMDGITVLKTIRSQGNNIPVLILTARAEINDKVLGLDSGANDYLTKPFDTQELLARIRSITRFYNAGGSILSMGNITLNRATFELSSPSGSFRLTNKEFQLMEILITNSRNLISTERLMEKIWGFNSDSEINVVWVYISYLRKKLKALHADIQIKAARNAGYALEEIPRSGRRQND